MNQEEAIAATVVYLRGRGITFEANAPIVATFRKADQFEPHDNWVVLVETSPGCIPSDTAVVIRYPELTPTIVKIM